MPSDIVETRTLFYAVTADRPVVRFVVGLRQEQVDYLERCRRQEEERAAAGVPEGKGRVKGSEHLGNAGYVAPENVKEYGCFRCGKAYQDGPKVEVTVSEITEEECRLVMTNYFCGHCGEWLADAGTRRDLDELMKRVDRKLIVKDYTGKYVPFTKDFLEDEFDGAVRLSASPHMIYRLEHDLYKIGGWGREIGHDMNDRVHKKLLEGYEKAFLWTLEQKEKYWFGEDWLDFHLGDAAYFLGMLERPPTAESAKVLCEWAKDERKWWESRSDDEEEESRREGVRRAEEKCRRFLTELNAP